MENPPNMQPRTNSTANYFGFETDFVESLQCIPMQVRMKLDNCGVKLKLVHWNQLNKVERQALVDMPCATVEQRRLYKEWLQNLIVNKTGQPAKELEIDPNPPWLNADSIPQSVRTKAESDNVSLSLEQWANLAPAERFALIKLSRPSHENKNFLPALKEFGIIAVD